MTDSISKLSKLLNYYRRASERAIEDKTDDGALFFADGEDLLKILDYVDQAHTTIIKLLSDRDKLQKDLAQSHYLSVLWIKMLDSFVPKSKKREAMSACAQAIAEGMKQAGIKEYEANLEQLEQQVKPE